MSEWAYKATPDGVSLEETRRLLDDHGFLCRVAYSSSGKMIANVKKVAMGDIVHVYYVAGDAIEAVGAFEISSPHKLGRGDEFGRTVKGTTLRLPKGSLADELAAIEGYDEDETAGGYPGWTVLPSDAVSPDFDAGWFRGQSVLTEL